VSFEIAQANTSGVKRDAFWLIRFLLPSASDFVFLIFLVAMCSLAPRILGDAGIGWHIRNGELILRAHSMTRADPFSATMNGQPWYAWEWLYDIFIASIHQSLGLNGVVFVTNVVTATTFALALRICLRRGALLPIALILVALSIGGSSIHLFARPHVFSWLFALIWFALLDGSHSAELTQSPRNLFWLPPLMLLWTNVHGGFVLGFVLLGIYFLCAFLDLFRGQNEPPRVVEKLRLLASVAALCFFASLVNPFGYKLHLHIYRYLSNRWLMNHIDEFLSPNFHGLPQQCFAALLLITFVALAIAPNKPRVEDLLIIVFAAYSGLYASRNLPVSCLLLTVMVSPLLSSSVAQANVNPNVAPRTRAVIWRCHMFAARMSELELRFRGHLWPVVVVILGVVVCLHGGKVGDSRLMDAHFDGKRFPVEAVDFMVQHQIRQPIFAPDYWGGYLIYRLYGGNKVFVDDRHDFYGDDFLKAYLMTIRLTPDWDAFLQAHQVGWVLVPSESSLANMLKESPPWNIEYQDKTAVLFERAKPLDTLGRN
jgi:hypothetical protein